MGRTAAILVASMLWLFLATRLALSSRPASVILPHQDGTGILTGVAWVDADGEGDLDEDEPRVAWVHMVLERPGGLRQEQYTDQQGIYQFAGLEGGYLLNAVPPGGYELFEPGPWFVQVQSGQTLTVNVRLRQVGTPAPTPTATPSPTVTPTATPTPYWDWGMIKTAYCQGVYLDSNEGGPHQADTYSCVPYWSETGPEQVYVFHSIANQWITVTLDYDPGVADLDVFLLAAPDPAQCVAAGDRFAQVEWQPADLYVVVDGYQGSVGHYKLFVECQGGPLATSTPTPTASPTPTITPTPTATLTPTPTPTPMLYLAYLPVWLRVYPQPTPTPTVSPTPTVTPMPTRIILQNGLSGYNGMVDTFLSAWSPDTNYGGARTLSVRYDRPPGPTDVMSALIRFDLSVLPARAVISGAWLELYAENRSSNNEMRVAAYQVLRPWTEDQATWNRADSNHLWGQPGCNDPVADCSALSLDTITVNTVGKWYRWNVGPAAQAWAANKGANWGVILRGLAGAENANVQYDFASSEAAATRRPRLIVDYWVTP